MNLKQQGYRLLLLSNTTISHFEFIQQHWNMLSLFDDYILSYEVNAMKPEAAIYQAALSKIECAPEEAFFTDDIPENIEQARKHGLKAEVFTNVEKLKIDFTKYGIHF